MARFSKASASRSIHAGAPFGRQGTHLEACDTHNGSPYSSAIDVKPRTPPPPAHGSNRSRSCSLCSQATLPGWPLSLSLGMISSARLRRERRPRQVLQLNGFSGDGVLAMDRVFSAMSHVAHCRSSTSTDVPCRCSSTFHRVTCDGVDLAERDSASVFGGDVAEPDPKSDVPFLHCQTTIGSLQERIHPHGPPTSR
jgi:hypothetical protein